MIVESIEQSFKRSASALISCARHLGLLKLLVTCVPALAFCCAISTVTICLAMWRSGSSYMPGLIFPAVSEIGVDLPQKRVYQIGFGLCGALLSLSIGMFCVLVAPRLVLSAGDETKDTVDVIRSGSQVQLARLQSAASLNGQIGVCKDFDEKEKRWTIHLSDGKSKAIRPENLVVYNADRKNVEQWSKDLVRWGHGAAAGVALQGIFTLEHGQASIQCFVHWGGAVLFMMGANLHGKASNQLYDKLAEDGNPLVKASGVAMALKARHFILDYSSMGIFMLPLLMQFIPAFNASTGAEEVEISANMSNSTDSKSLPFDPKMMNTMGIMQWAIILQFAFFFCTYMADLRAAVDYELKESKKEKNS